MVTTQRLVSALEVAGLCRRPVSERVFAVLDGLLTRDARETAARHCQRCASGHAVWPPRQGFSEWEHGTDELEGGVTCGPEPCGAAALWAFLEGSEGA